jgi:putative effector of murein hydrolase LrgA (UPF0299 family)
MLNYLTLIFCFQLAGELTNKLLALSVPGPVIGMVLLFCVLLWRGAIPTDLARAADGLLGHFSLLFVPSGVGVMLHFSLLGEDWLAIGVALVISTLLTIAVTAWLMTLLARGSGTRARDTR